MRVVFAGTPQPAVPSLNALAKSHTLTAVVSRTDAPVGRKRVLTPSAVSQAALSLGLPLIRTDRFAADIVEELAALRPDVGVVAAYGALVPDSLLVVPRLGWVNVHFSALPRWRGAAPVQHAVAAGDESVGVSIMQLVSQLDAGAVYKMATIPVGVADAGELTAKLSLLGADLLLETLAKLELGTAIAMPQEGGASYAPKLNREFGRIDWSRPQGEVLRRIQAATPEPGAFSTLHGSQLGVLSAAAASNPVGLPAGEIALGTKQVLVGTASDPIELLEVKPAGKRAMSALDWARGGAKAGLRLGA